VKIGDKIKMQTSSRFAVAVHILALMAGADDEPIKSDQMAGSVNTNPVVIRRILCSLSRAELVTSQTGAAGGSRLARKAGQISLLDVYRAVEEGGVFALHRQSPSRHCPVGGAIESVLNDVLGEVNLAVERALAKTTIEQVFQSVRERKGSAKQRPS
jgi:Rrf2 family protein